MQLKDIMTREVEGVSSDASILAAASRMAALDVGFLPVIDNDHVVGVVTDRDITVRVVAQGRDPAQTLVGEVMTPEAELVSEDQEVEQAAKLMKEKQIRRLVVCGVNDRIVGVVSLGDLAQHTGDTALSGDTLEKVSEPEPPAK